MTIARGGAVTAVLELYGRHELAVDGALTSKWGAIMRVAEQARQGALAAFVTRQLADDRLAVTTVVDALGHTEETAEATERVSEQIAALRATAESVAAGIRTTSDTIGQMDAVQARIGEVLEEQATMAHAFER
ncbi:hypothetical protein [Actinoplanes subtropicus]|uniref:hypothetical protein n=1 Tax=Actinoplanes subtropicus TaxID=543632 RepID=UPI0004C40036|nr:hypothetical protein [Actinoplanes subtropicus]